MKENLSTTWANTINICGGPGFRPGDVQFFHIYKGLGKLNTHYNSPDYAAVYPGAIISPCQKLPGLLTTTGGDESSTNCNFH